MANVLIVAYDLHEKPEKNYQALSYALKSYDHSFEFQKSVWLIETSESRAEVRDFLKKSISSDDKLFVGSLSGASWSNTSELSNFLKQFWNIS